MAELYMAFKNYNKHLLSVYDMKLQVCTNITSYTKVIAMWYEYIVDYDGSCWTALDICSIYRYLRHISQCYCLLTSFIRLTAIIR
jgi:hypothetical protein